jgi:osmotically-inducible protein OsmY
MDLSVLLSTDCEIATQARPPATTVGRKAEDLLRRSGYLALRDVSCVALGGALYLRGRLPTYYLKQVAQEIAASVAGACRIINRIEVTAPGERPSVGRDPGRGPANAPY